MARGRAKFGTRFKPTAKESARRKKSAQSTKRAVKNVSAAVQAASKEISRQKKASAKEKARSANHSVKNGASIPVLQVETSGVSNQETPSVTPSGVRFLGAILIFIGLLICILFWPIGLVVTAFGVYHIVCARKIAGQNNKKALPPNDGGEDL